MHKISKSLPMKKKEEAPDEDYFLMQLTPIPNKKFMYNEEYLKEEARILQKKFEDEQQTESDDYINLLPMVIAVPNQPDSTGFSRNGKIKMFKKIKNLKSSQNLKGKSDLPDTLLDENDESTCIGAESYKSLFDYDLVSTEHRTILKKTFKLKSLPDYTQSKELFSEYIKLIMQQVSQPNTQDYLKQLFTDVPQTAMITLLVYHANEECSRHVVSTSPLDYMIHLQNNKNFKFHSFMESNITVGQPDLELESLTYKRSKFLKAKFRLLYQVEGLPELLMMHCDWNIDLENLYGGKYTKEEIEEILAMNSRPQSLLKPLNPFYRKTHGEFGPTWQQRREFVHWLINESNISAASKMYLKECEQWVPKYQLRGLKYGLTTSLMTFFLMPVVRRQPFIRRFGVSMIPMAWFLNWGYVWGHENYWRRVKEVVVTYEIFAGARSRFTTK